MRRGVERLLEMPARSGSGFGTSAG